VGLTGGPHQGVAAAAVLPTRAARAGRVEGVGAVRPPRRQAGPRRGWATRGEGKEEGERAACLARPREAHGGEGRGAGWATAGSWPKKGGREKSPSFILFLIFPFNLFSNACFHKLTQRTKIDAWTDMVQQPKYLTLGFYLHEISS
jgi:hypothetical protein